MATGDMKNNLKKLQASLKTIKYEKDVDIESLSKGVPGSFLPLYHYAFIDFSRFVAEKIAELNIELYGKSDLRFIEGMYKVLREIFSFKPPLTKDQFFSNGFAEKKVIMCTTILRHVYNLHNKLAPKQRPKTAPTAMTSTSLASITSATSTLNHKKHPAAQTHSVTAKPPTIPAKGKQENAPRNVMQGVMCSSQQAPVPTVFVQNELRAPRNAVDTMERTEPSDLFQRPKTTQNNTDNASIPDLAETPVLGAPRPQPAPAYNPSVYCAEEETPRSQGQLNQPHVEIVSLHADGENNSLPTNLRPIDTIPKTPGRPLIQASVQRHYSHHNGAATAAAAGTSRGDCQDPAQNVLLAVQEKLNGVAKLADLVNSLTERMLRLEENLAAVNVQPAQAGVSTEAFENIQARVTLLENNYKLVQAQLKQSAPAPAPHNDEPDPDSLEMHSSTTHSLPYSHSTHARTLHSFTDGQAVLPAMASTPVEPVHTTYTTDSNKLPQADRIKAMLKDTAGMLNIEVESPVRTPAAHAERAT